MTDTYLEQIWLDKFDKEDEIALQMALDAGIFGHKVEHILADVETFTTQLWRGECRGQRFIMVTQMFDHPGGRELRIWSVGGHGYIRALDHSYSVLEAYARKYGCKWITGLVSRNGFERLYKRFKYKDLYRNWIVEIDNVSDQTKH